MQAFAQSEEAKKALQALGDHSSMTERRADDATRDAVRWLKCEYIQKHIGEEFEGLISGVTRFGFFVELKDIYIDGLVHVTSLRNDYYFFDPVHHRLVGERSGTIFRLGDSLKVRVLSVDVDQRKIDFDLIETLNATRKQRQKQKQGQKHKQERKEKRHPEKRGPVKATKGASKGMVGSSNRASVKDNKTNKAVGKNQSEQKQGQKATQKQNQKQEQQNGKILAPQKGARRRRKKKSNTKLGSNQKNQEKNSK